MELSMGNVILLIVVFLSALYFVVKWAVKNGINQSMLFTDDDRRKKYEDDMKKVEEYRKK